MPTRPLEISVVKNNFYRHEWLFIEVTPAAM